MDSRPARVESLLRRLACVNRSQTIAEQEISLQFIRGETFAFMHITRYWPVLPYAELETELFAHITL